MVIQWNSTLATGVKTIDDQHKEMFSRLNDLLKACDAGKGKEEVGRAIGFLEEYVVSHFGEENKYMVEYDYPNLLVHKQQHDQFIKDVVRIRQQFEAQSGSISVVLRTNRMIVDWLLNHISRSDMELGVFLKTKLK